MGEDQPYPPTGWGHRIKEENRHLREKVAVLQQNIKRLERRLQSAWGLLEHVPGGLILVQKEKVLFVNEAVCRAFGYTRDEMSALSISDLLGPDWAKVAIALSESGPADASRPHTNDMALKTRTGHPLYAQVRARKTLYRGKTTFLLHIVAFDPTAWHEKRVRESGKAEALTRMAAAFRHELDLFSTLLPKEIFPEPHLGAVEGNGLKNLRRIDAIREKEALLRQHLDCLTRTEYNPRELTILDLRKLLKAAVDISHPELSAQPPSPATIQTFIRAPCNVYGCGQELRDAFVNILLNAVEAVPDGGDIYLSAESHSGLVHIYIQDNGKGMSDDTIGKIFEPFFTTKEGHGMGLGLSLTQAIVARHQGDIHVESREGQGATVIVKLPLARDSAPAAPPPPAKILRDSHILIISRPGILTGILQNILTERGSSVSTAFSYGEGLRILGDMQVDLIVMDQSVFRGDAVGIARRIKRLWPDRMLAVTNATESSGVLKTEKNMGADLVMERPLNLDRFIAEVAALMGKGGSLQ